MCCGAMGILSKTGLLPSPTKQIRDVKKNPFPYGCSLLCNHPTDLEARELLKRAKDTWTYEGKNLLLAEEIAAIRATLDANLSRLELPADTVPEELFRRYTDTDSRPLTPAPTIASSLTRASGSRRCVTPDPMRTSEVREKTLLVLDLRRSHSQETISWCASSSALEPPLIRIQQVGTRSTSPVTIPSETHTPEAPKKRSPRVTTPSTTGGRRPEDPKEQHPVNKHPEDNTNANANNKNNDDDDFVKRKGKRRRKRGRDLSGGPSSLQQPTDPETQVSTIGPESHNASARPSLVPQDVAHESLEGFPGKKGASKRASGSFDFRTFLSSDVLKHLRRELTEEVIENEFNLKRRKALQEALKTVDPNKEECEELKQTRNELNLRPVNTDLWLTLPRVFTRSSARFELPIDSRTLSTMTPLEYVKEHVDITSPRKLLYNCVFNKFVVEEPTNRERRIRGQDVLAALNLMMGTDLTQLQAENVRHVIGWSENEAMDYRTFCGLCALCERLLAPEYCKQLPDRKTDPCHEVETADFEGLERRLEGRNVDERLKKILFAIKNF